MTKNNSWNEMYRNFKSLYPNLCKKAVDYRPYGYMTIIVWFNDGTKMKYDDSNKRGQWITN